jgi:hypothetical protein
VEIYLRTRGRPRELDYRFLGQAPEDFWWRSYLQVTDIERPTVLVRSNGATWQAYIAGIRSSRADATDNAIAFNLALTGDCGPADEGALALAIITRSVTDLAAHNGLFIAGDPLDERLLPDEVDHMLATPGKETAVAAADAVRAAYGPDAAGEPPTPAEGDWIGGLANPKAREAFAALAARLLDGSRTGQAVALNLVAAEGDLDELPAADGDLGVLSVLPGPRLGMGVKPLGKKEEPPSEDSAAEAGKTSWLRLSRPRHSRTGSPNHPVGSRKTVLIVAGVVVGAVVIAIILIEVLRQPPTR